MGTQFSGTDENFRGQESSSVENGQSTAVQGVEPGAAGVGSGGAPAGGNSRKVVW